MEPLSAAGRWRSAALTHCGRRHSENEDSCLDRPDVGLWAVADGMGGHADGQVASRTLCQALEQIPPMPTLVALEAAVQAAVADANRALRARAASRSPTAVIGTTVAVLMIHSGYAVCAWCGDSRVHLKRDGEVFLLTRDHTVVQEMLDRGEIDQAAARTHRSAHVVARAVGVARAADLESLAIEVRHGDRFLLCTDGISRYVTVAELAEMVGDDPIATVRDAVDLAQARGTADDVTAIAIVVDGPGAGP